MKIWSVKLVKLWPKVLTYKEQLFDISKITVGAAGGITIIITIKTLPIENYERCKVTRWKQPIYFSSFKRTTYSAKFLNLSWIEELKTSTWNVLDIFCFTYMSFDVGWLPWKMTAILSWQDIFQFYSLLTYKPVA